MARLKFTFTGTFILFLWCARCLVHCGQLLAHSSNSKAILNYNVNTRKAVNVVSDRFVSFTVDPENLLRSTDCQMSDAIVNMAKGLIPAYVRIAGPNSNKYIFKSLSAESNLPDNKYKSAVTENSKNYTITGSQWISLNNLVKEIGFDMIVSLNGDLQNGHAGLSDLSNAVELISFSDRYDFKLDWQLGYELQKVAVGSGKEMGQDVVRLRKILQAFPKYYNSLLLGPDMSSFETRQDAMFIKNYLAEAGNSLNIFTWHPSNLTSLKEDEDPVHVFQNTLTQLDNYIWIKDGLFKTYSRGVVPKKPMWIGESETKNPEVNFKDAMLWAKKLGAAAKLGMSVYMRKPHQLSLFEPTPEYWLALLHKALVGKIVLDVRSAAANNSTKLHIFGHCTQIPERPNEGVINGSLKYSKGAVTIFGVNSAHERSRLMLKLGLKSSDENQQPIHQYILTESIDEISYSSKILLNGQSLTLSEDNELPIVSPKIRNNSSGSFSVPARSIFFLVLPEAKCRLCSQENVPIKSKKLIADDEYESDYSSSSNSLQEMMDDDGNYVAFRKSGVGNSIDGKTSSPMKPEQPPEPVVKYVTFTGDSSWLSAFPDKLNEGAEDKAEDEEDVKKSDAFEDDDDYFDPEINAQNHPAGIPSSSLSSSSRSDKYKLIFQALSGNRKNATRRDRGEISTFFDEEAKSKKTNNRYKRSAFGVEDCFYFPDEDDYSLTDFDDLSLLLSNYNFGSFGQEKRSDSEQITEPEVTDVKKTAEESTLHEIVAEAIAATEGYTSTEEPARASDSRSESDLEHDAPQILETVNNFVNEIESGREKREATTTEESTTSEETTDAELIGSKSCTTSSAAEESVASFTTTTAVPQNSEPDHSVLPASSNDLSLYRDDGTSFNKAARENRDIPEDEPEQARIVSPFTEKRKKHRNKFVVAQTKPESDEQPLTVTVPHHEEERPEEVRVDSDAEKNARRSPAKSERSSKMARVLTELAERRQMRRNELENRLSSRLEAIKRQLESRGIVGSGERAKRESSNKVDLQAILDQLLGKRESNKKFDLRSVLLPLVEEHENRKEENRNRLRNSITVWREKIQSRRSGSDSKDGSKSPDRSRKRRDLADTERIRINDIINPHLERLSSPSLISNEIEDDLLNGLLHKAENDDLNRVSSDLKRMLLHNRLPSLGKLSTWSDSFKKQADPIRVLLNDGLISRNANNIEDVVSTMNDIGDLTVRANNLRQRNNDIVPNLPTSLNNVKLAAANGDLDRTRLLNNILGAPVTTPNKEEQPLNDRLVKESASAVLQELIDVFATVASAVVKNDDLVRSSGNVKTSKRSNNNNIVINDGADVTGTTEKPFATTGLNNNTIISELAKGNSTEADSKSPFREVLDKVGDIWSSLQFASGVWV